MATSAIAWIENPLQKVLVMISKELFDSTITFMHSDLADVKAEVRETRAVQIAQGEKLDSFRDKLDSFKADLERKIDERFAAADKRMDEKLAAAQTGVMGGFTQVDTRLDS